MSQDLVFDNVQEYSDYLNLLNLHYSLDGYGYSTNTRLHLIDHLIITYSENLPSTGLFYDTHGESIHYGLRFLFSGSELYHMNQDKILLSQEECFLFQPKNAGFYERKTPSTGINFLIPKEILAPKITNFNHHGDKLTCKTGLGKIIFTEILHAEQELHHLSDYQKKLVLMNLIVLIAEWLNETQSETKEFFLQLTDYINQNIFETSLSLESVASAFSKSPRTIQKAFSQKQLTFSKYLSNKRLIAASQELAFGHTAIIDIATKYGFYDSSHFSRSFKHKYKCTPSLYRKKQHKLKERTKKCLLN
ncbi:helix-turn-helix transcriptional regulator [Enterococcus sp. ALS3]|uniref:Helix-turn-helix transcriptional regulator n=1 Tax=Enterococcus alishanensis TaxID=1303817 RepID=A0ABS6THP5_9ENTE|nr:helix-turn-helix transcriptional regulator [Enterococcus alishanensis]MBV7392423.1 helix-turn-helix transcriptional regulator [Enterococcus alishanensis]